jgi:pre-60S factor REI1
MAKHHSFFVPFIDKAHNLKGLIAHLGAQISVENLCLYCNEKGRRMYSLEAVRAHMVPINNPDHQGPLQIARP